MKISIVEGQINLRADNATEGEELIAYWGRNSTKDISVKITRPYTLTKEHKRHSFKYPCSICQKMCKGKIGLAVHERHHQRTREAFLAVTNPRV
jgi:hypothetical protein